MRKQLLLCAGPTRPAGFLRLDSNPEHEPDFLATIPPLPVAVRAESWNVVELVHGIEHFVLWDVAPLIREVYDVLAPGGLFVLEQPNLAAACRVFCGLEPPQYKGILESAMWPIYGDPAHRDLGYLHRWGWTPASLTGALLDAAPWREVKTLPQRYHSYAAGRDFRVEAIK